MQNVTVQWIHYCKGSSKYGILLNLRGLWEFEGRCELFPRQNEHIYMHVMFCLVFQRLPQLLNFIHRPGKNPSSKVNYKAELSFSIHWLWTYICLRTAYPNSMWVSPFVSLLRTPFHLVLFLDLEALSKSKLKSIVQSDLISLS